MDPVIGFEFEFLTKIDDTRVLDDFGSQGLRFLSHRGSYKNWTLARESLNPEGVYTKQRELVSPIMAWDTGIENLKKVLEVLDSSNYLINTSCGLHVNLSYPNQYNVNIIDPAKLVVHLDEYGILSRFVREDNPYCAPHRRDHSLLIRQHGKPTVVNNSFGVEIQYPDSMPLVNGFFSLRRNKFKSVNIGRLYNSDYIEFRMIGGIDYASRVDDILTSIEEYRSAMNYSVDINNSEDFMKRKANYIEQVINLR